MAAAKSPGGFWGALRHAFAVPGGEELTERERAFLDRLACKVVERGLASVAVFFLESARPLNYLGSQVVVFFKPIISLVFSDKECEEVAELLAKRGAVEALVEMIEARDAARAADAEGR